MIIPDDADLVFHYITLSSNKQVASITLDHGFKIIQGQGKLTTTLTVSNNLTWIRDGTFLDLTLDSMGQSAVYVDVQRSIDPPDYAKTLIRNYGMLSS